MKAHPINLSHNSVMFAISTDEGALCDLVYFAGYNRANEMGAFWICHVELIGLLESAIEHTPTLFEARRFVPQTEVPGYGLEYVSVNGTDRDRFAIYITSGDIRIHIGSTDDGIPVVIKFLTSLKDVSAELLELNMNGIGNLYATTKKLEIDTKFKSSWYSFGDLTSIQWVNNTFAVSNWDIRRRCSRVEIISGVCKFSHRIPVSYFDKIREVIKEAYNSKDLELFHHEFESDLHVFASKVYFIGGGDIINLSVLDRYATSNFKISATDEHLQVLMDAFTIDPTLPGIEETF